MQYGSGCHSDQLVGQWWANILDLGYVLPKEHIRKAIKSIYMYNYRTDLSGHKQEPRKFLREDEGGLLICSWPHGGRPRRPTLYSDEVWTGMEYEVAGLLFQEGMVEEGLALVENTTRRQNGEIRSPWNEVERGDHYVRPMSSWSMIEALAGYGYDSVARQMRFDPGIDGNLFQCFFCTDLCWGTYEQIRGDEEWTFEIAVAYGTLKLETIRLLEGRVHVSRVEAYVGGSIVDVKWEREGGFLLARGQITVPRDERLRIVARS